ncbi:SDR family NAD(P)-dependent oxidoreductase [Ectopseudomonas toyotomiensis]|uniref:SDR family oxidoreductase n=1 Tax=Ectopseudomonas toyotomiensis TaxID=554344 RepID=A0AA42ILE9_9GAMM|nr:SDR family oxidoreductase [Pseudomonas toyotomiensis]MBG0839378.1 SDR family oxidoreductase [Pseudomonas toyotomiensis]MDH0701937.1 SDR family oxidoreductase [Pseudomonas toyotomiensis]
MNAQSTFGTALITGASSGIGATYAERLARRGYDLLLVARDAQRLDALAKRLGTEYGVAVEVMPADLTSKADVLKVEKRLREDSNIALLINNAGIAMNGPLAAADLEQAEAMIQLNVVALTRLAAAAAANFSAVGRGGIINLGSVVALAPEMFNAVYSATKAYVLSLTQTLAGELRGSGVQLQAVLPGVTRTEIWERSGTDASALPPSMIMEVGEMVDAALAGFDQGERVTIPSLPDAADWDAFVAARAVLGPNLSHSQAAARYK